MDNIKSLMDRKEYELVCKLAQTSNDPTTIFYGISAYVALSKPEQALELITKNRQILQSKLAILIKMHIEILCVMSKFDEAYKELDYYQNLPYESQEVEEILRDSATFIKNEEKNAIGGKNYSVDDIKELLRSKNPDDELLGLDLLRDFDIRKFMDEINHLLVFAEKAAIRCFALLVLVSKEYKGTVSYNLNSEIIKVDVGTLVPPFTTKSFKEIADEIHSEWNNPSLSEIGLTILSSYAMYIFPKEIVNNKEVVKEAVFALANEMLKQTPNEDIQFRCQKKKISFEEVLVLKEKIEEAVNNF